MRAPPAAESRHTRWPHWQADDDMQTGIPGYRWDDPEGEHMARVSGACHLEVAAQPAWSRAGAHHQTLARTRRRVFRVPSTAGALSSRRRQAIEFDKKRGDHKRALRSFRAAAQFKRNPTTLMNIGTCLLNAGKALEAVSALHEARMEGIRCAARARLAPAWPA